MSQIRMVVLGDSCVGKTTLLGTFTRNAVDLGPTVGVDYFAFDVGDTRVQAWDPSGHPRFIAVREAFYLGVDVCMFVCDVSNRATFDHLPTWYDEFTSRNIAASSMFCVGNKTDLRHEAGPQGISTEDARSVAKRLGLDYYECSALDPSDVVHVFRLAARAFPKKKQTVEITSDAVVSKRSCCWIWDGSCIRLRYSYC